MGKPGIITCLPYILCAAQGDTYAAGAFLICQGTPNNGWSNCARNCLLGRYTCNQSAAKNVRDHAACFLLCALLGIIFRIDKKEEPISSTPRPGFFSNLKTWTLG